MNSKLVAIDLAKNVFQICVVNQAGKVTMNRQVSRNKLLQFVLNLNPESVVMESCYSANYWGRLFNEHHITVKLIPAQFVKPFVRGHKNDKNDAVAIAEASMRPYLKYVPVKTVAQQDIQSLHRIRQRRVSQCTALINQIRGLLSEYGIIVAQSKSQLLKQLPVILENADNQLSEVALGFTAELKMELDTYIKQIKADEKKLHHLLKENEDYQRLMTIPGFGHLVSSALIAAAGNGAQFKNGRALASWLGLTPKHHASGETLTSGGITKRGNRYLRTLLIHGARAAFTRCKRRDSYLFDWAKGIMTRRGKQKAWVALANKLARVAWAVLNKKSEFDYRLGIL